MFKSLIFILLSILTLLVSSLTMRQLSAQSPLENQSEKQAEIFLQKGLIKLFDNNYQGALNDFNQAIELNPNSAQAYYQRGVVYAKYAFGNPPTTNQLPPYCSLVNQIPVCSIDLTKQWRNENLINALKDLDKSLELNPNYAPTYYQKALIFEANQQTQQAIEFYEKAMNLYSAQGLNYLRLNQPQQAAYFLNYSNLSYQKIKAITSLNSSPQSPSLQEDTGNSTHSPDRQKSPEHLFADGCELMKIPDYTTALQKFRQAARLFQEGKNEKRYQETQEIIQILEQYV